MSTPEDLAATREPLPEERVVERGDEDGLAEAEIMRDSEERLADAVDGNAPGDAADEHRASADSAD